MNLKSTVLGIFGAAVMTMSMIGGAGAATTQAEVSVKVGAPDNAVLAASITGGAFREVKYRAGNSSQNSDGTITITATDTRGLGTGWNVKLRANGDFVAEGNKSFSINTFSLQSGSVQGLNSANANGITAQAIGGVGTSSQTVLVAQQGSGMGEFTNTVNGTIKVPDGTLVGDYKTTLTVEITAGQ